MDTYTEAFELSYNNVPCCRVVGEAEGSVRLSIQPFWLEGTPPISFNLTVPLVVPIRYRGDENIYGFVIRIPTSKTERFAHPLLISKVAESIANEEVRGLSG